MNALYIQKLNFDIKLGWISYPRTETNKYPPTINLKNLVANQFESHIWGPYAWELLGNNYIVVNEDQQEDINENSNNNNNIGKFNRPRNGNKNDQAHPPIHPVRWHGDNNSLTPDQKKLYELIARHF